VISSLTLLGESEHLFLPSVTETSGRRHLTIQVTHYLIRLNRDLIRAAQQEHQTSSRLSLHCIFLPRIDIPGSRHPVT